MITGITQSATETQAESSSKMLAADLDAFLLLLTKQLQNQDPLSPLEPTEFTQQLVSFASVEQQIQSNKNLEELTNVQNSTFAASVVGFIGTEITADGNGVPLQNGSADFTYLNSAAASNVIITIADQFGTNLLTRAGERAAGEHVFTWDGKDAFGAQQPDGPYTVSVSAVGANQEAIPVTTTTKGKVTGVAAENGVTVLDMNGVGIPLESVISIAEPKALAP